MKERISWSIYADHVVRSSFQHPLNFHQNMAFLRGYMDFVANTIHVLNDISYGRINGELLYIHSIICLLISIAVAFAIYWLFFIPCNWRKRLDEVSYDVVLKNEARGKYKTAGKREAINRMRLLRGKSMKDLPPPYPNGWYSLLESSALKKGNAVAVSCLGENFVVYRTLKGDVNVLDAFCPHLGANIGMGGRVIGDNIECPFHGWSFQGSDGRCANIPYSNSGLPNARLRKWISRELNDNIFVWYHVEQNQDPWEIPIVQEIENKELVFQGRNEFYVNCHIQEIPENGADLAHFAAIHKASMFAGGEDPLKSIFANLGQHCWDAVWSEAEPAKHLAKVKLSHSVQLWPKVNIFHMDVVAQQVGPSYVQMHMKSPTLGYIKVLQTVTPVEPLVQKVVHRFYAHKALGPIMKVLVFGESVMFERDMAIWNHKVYRSNPQLVKEDKAVKSFRTWYSQFYTANSKSFAEAKDNLEW